MREHRVSLQSAHCSPRKSLSQKKTRSSRKNQKKFVRVSSRKRSSRKTSPRPHHFVKGSLASWKFRKKKSSCFRRSPLKEPVSWKFRKKKSAYARSSPLKESTAWKRRKKKGCSSKRLFFVFIWDPGISTLLKTHESSCFPAGSVRTHGLYGFNGTTSTYYIH